MSELSVSGPVDSAGRPLIERLGTIECDLVECTPIVFNDRVYRCEWVRTSYKGNRLGRDYGRLIDHESGWETEPIGIDHIFHSAFVEDGTVYVLGTSGEAGWNGARVNIFASTDLRHWEEWNALHLDGFAICNTSLCKAGDRYALMFEISRPEEQTGVPFTARFAFSDDLRHWEVTPPECNYAKDRYTAPHCLRWQDGWYYDFYLELTGDEYEMRVVRSRDLIYWGASPLNPVMRAAPEDRIPRNPNFTPEELHRLATAVDANNSDIDFCEYHGRLIITYSWGNQGGIEHLAEAVYHGTLAQFLRGWFPEG